MFLHRKDSHLMGLAKTDTVLILLPPTLWRPGYGSLGMGLSLSFLIDSEAAWSTLRYNLTFLDL